MVNKRLKKLTAMLLSIVMVFSMVTEAFPPYWRWRVATAHPPHGRILKT